MKLEQYGFMLMSKIKSMLRCKRGWLVISEKIALSKYDNSEEDE